MNGLFASLAIKLKALPDGALLRSVFYGLVGLATFLVATDFRELVNSSETGSFAMPPQSPVRMDRPERDNQIRPYLPFTRPVAPDEDEAEAARVAPHPAMPAATERVEAQNVTSLPPQRGRSEAG